MSSTNNTGSSPTKGKKRSVEGDQPKKDEQRNKSQKIEAGQSRRSPASSTKSNPKNTRNTASDLINEIGLQLIDVPADKTIDERLDDVQKIIDDARAKHGSKPPSKPQEGLSKHDEHVAGAKSGVDADTETVDDERNAKKPTGSDSKLENVDAKNAEKLVNSELETRYMELKATHEVLTKQVGDFEKKFESMEKRDNEVREKEKKLAEGEKLLDRKARALEKTDRRKMVIANEKLTAEVDDLKNINEKLRDQLDAMLTKELHEISDDSDQSSVISEKEELGEAKNEAVAAPAPDQSHKMPEKEKLEKAKKEAVAALALEQSHKIPEKEKLEEAKKEAVAAPALEKSHEMSEKEKNAELKKKYDAAWTDKAAMNRYLSKIANGWVKIPVDRFVNCKEYLAAPEILRAIFSVTEAIVTDPDGCSSSLYNVDQQEAMIPKILDERWAVQLEDRITRPRKTLYIPWNKHTYSDMALEAPGSTIDMLQETATKLVGHWVLTITDIPRVTHDGQPNTLHSARMKVMNSASLTTTSTEQAFHVVKNIVNRAQWYHGPMVKGQVSWLPDELIPVAEQMDGITCGLHCIINAWIHALGLKADPSFLPSERDYRKTELVINRAIAGQASSQVIYAVLFSVGWVYPRYGGVAPERRFEKTVALKTIQDLDERYETLRDFQENVAWSSAEKTDALPMWNYGEDDENAFFEFFQVR